MNYEGEEDEGHDFDEISNRDIEFTQYKENQFQRL